jgi:multidrug resistance efflux pump
MKEQLQARIADLEKQKEQMLANFHAISGAIAENEAWLRQLEKDANSPAED